METKTGNRVMKIQTNLAMNPTIFELWVMETELWVMETENPNSPLAILHNSINIINFQNNSNSK